MLSADRIVTHQDLKNQHATSEQTWKTVPRSGQTEAQKKLIENYKNSNKHINPKAPRQQPSLLNDLN